MGKAQNRLQALEWDVSTENAFSNLKDKQIDEALSKLLKAGPKAVEKFKKFDKYSEKLCDYYVEGFELFSKYMVKHHPYLDFSTLYMEVVEKEILVDCPSDAIVGNVDMMEDDTIITTEALVDPSPSILFLVSEKHSSWARLF